MSQLFKIPDSARVGKVRLAVSSLDRSLKFYTEVIGFKLIRRTGNTAELGTANTILLELEEQPGLRPLNSQRLGLYHFAVLLPSRSSLGAFARHTHELRIRLGSADHLVSEAFYLVDPDGLTVEVYADRPRAQWPRPANGTGVTMATDPLDLSGLIAAAQGVPWDGLPSGTVVGHMHFYIGDLGQGATFYELGLGMQRMAAFGGAALFLAAGGYHHHVGINTWARGSAIAGQNDPRLRDWELVLPTAQDVQSVEQSLRANNFPGTAGRFRDPWGIEVSLVAESQ